MRRREGRKQARGLQAPGRQATRERKRGRKIERVGVVKVVVVVVVVVIVQSMEGQTGSDVVLYNRQKHTLGTLTIKAPAVFVRARNS